MERAIVVFGNESPLDIALHDALARTLDIPVATLLGESG
jgi:L-alanine-DL-glutamate epimerase-like enolase superfamily enzyme